MVNARNVFRMSTPRSHGDRSGFLLILRVLALLGLFLLPIEVRAGTEQAHPHALLYLLIDLRDGAIDHHATPSHEDQRRLAHDGHDDGHGASQPDVPTVNDSTFAGGGLMVLAVLLIVLLLPPGTRAIWPRLASWAEHLPTLDPPPPRHATTGAR